MFALGTYQMHFVTKDWDFWELFWPQVFRGIGLMASIVPVTNVALGTLPPDRVKNASGLFNLTRNLGGAIGLAALTTALNDRLDLHLQRLHDSVNWSRGPAVETLANMTARFHDHSVMWPMPGWMKRSIQRRTADLNAIWDEVHATYGGLRLDLGAVPDLHERRFWAADRLHPSELGHRRMARAFGEQLVTYGFSFEPPSLEPSGGLPTSWRQDLAWMAGEGVPWMGRRARDLGPWVVRRAWARPSGEPRQETVA